jgi:hypothetical protein
MIDMCIDILLSNLVPGFASSLLELGNTRREVRPSSDIIFQGFPERLNGAEIG